MFRIGKDAKIHATAQINVEEGFIGDRANIRANAVIEGREIRIGHEAWIDEYAYIGGGSCLDPTSILEVGDFLHMGKFSHLNQGMGLRIGHEFGCGIGTRVFTHGAYESAWEGFPVQWGPVAIGDRVWMPNAWVNPGVKVGENVVVAAMSVVNDDIPSGCLAGGVPCKVLRQNVYPRKLSAEEKGRLFDRIFSESLVIYNSKRRQTRAKMVYERTGEDVFTLGKTMFDLADRKIVGVADEASEILKNQLRRNGIRFRYHAKDGMYSRW